MVKDATSGELGEPARAIFPQSVLILGQKGVLCLFYAFCAKSRPIYDNYAEYMYFYEFFLLIV